MLSLDTEANIKFVSDPVKATCVMQSLWFLRVCEHVHMLSSLRSCHNFQTNSSKFFGVMGLRTKMTEHRGRKNHSQDSSPTF